MMVSVLIHVCSVGDALSGRLVLIGEQVVLGGHTTRRKLQTADAALACVRRYLGLCNSVSGPEAGCTAARRRSLFVYRNDAKHKRQQVLE